MYCSMQKSGVSSATADPDMRASAPIAGTVDNILAITFDNCIKRNGGILYMRNLLFPKDSVGLGQLSR